MDKQGYMLEKILDIIEAIALEKNLTRESAIDAFKEALTNTAKKLSSPTSTFEVIIDPNKKTYEINKVITVVKDDDEKLYTEIMKEGKMQEVESDSFIALSDAKEFDESIELDIKQRRNRHQHHQQYVTTQLQIAVSEQHYQQGQCDIDQ